MKSGNRLQADDVKKTRRSKFAGTMGGADCPIQIPISTAQANPVIRKSN
jgi:hypothetical protein